ncbi:MAG: hypothetical protein WBE84_18240, partial [Xanthobacteraceae bacterium]
LISRGDLGVFVERPISAVFIGLCVILIGSQIYFRLKGTKPPIEPSLRPHDEAAPAIATEMRTPAE